MSATDTAGESLDYLITQNSTTIVFKNQDDVDVWMQNTDKNCLSEFKEIHIDVGEIGNSEHIAFSHFYEVLKTLKDVEKMSITFINLNIQEPEEFDNPKIEFSNLKSLRLSWRSGETSIAKIILNNVQSSSLEELFIDLPFEYSLNEAQCFFEFLLSNSKLIQKVHIWCRDNYGFKWNPKYVEIWSRDDIKSGILKFMENRVANLETFKLHWMNDSNFISEVFEWASYLKHFETSERCSEFCVGKTYPNIKELTLWIFADDSEDIKSIHSTFPNIKSIRFAYSRITKKNCNLIRELFTDLEEILSYEWMRN